ncbi:MAG: YicC family protein [Bacteroidales bacterium]|nr:MAG: YicC family protein [Bacteroidales bacterium]
MLISMTGFGKAEIQFNGKCITVEVKSLNSKQLDLNVKTPMIYRDREYDIRNLLSSKLIRGKIDFYISYDDKQENVAAPINAGIFKSYYQQIEAISEDCNISLSNEPVFQTILRLPDVLKIEKVEVTDDEWKAVFECINAAIDKMILFREQEGKALEKDITERVLLIEELLVKIEPFEKQRLETVKVKLQEGLKKLGKDVKVDNDRFEQEIIYYLEKMDVTEEKVRLRNHCEYFINTVNEVHPVGRKLGFILQEMGREINTLGSKASQAEMQKFVVLMKDELEKIKEQSLNIL